MLKKKIKKMFSINQLKDIFDKVIKECENKLVAQQEILSKHPFRSEEWFKIANSRRVKSPPLEKSVLLHANSPKEWSEIRDWVASSKTTSELSTRSAYCKFWSTFTTEAENNPEEESFLKTTLLQAKRELSTGVGSVRLPSKAEYHVSREKAFGSSLRNYCLNAVFRAGGESGESVLPFTFTRFELLNYIFPPRRSGEVSYNVFNFICGISDRHKKPNYYCAESDTIIFASYKGNSDVRFTDGKYHAVSKEPQIFEKFFSDILPRITPLRIFITDVSLIRRIISDAHEFVKKNVAMLNKPVSKKAEMRSGVSNAETTLTLWSSNDSRRFFETFAVNKVFNREDTMVAQEFLSHTPLSANIHYRKTDLEEESIQPLPFPLFPSQE